MALSSLQAASAGQHQAESVDAAGHPHTSPEALQTGTDSFTGLQELVMEELSHVQCPNLRTEIDE